MNCLIARDILGQNFSIEFNNNIHGITYILNEFKKNLLPPEQKLEISISREFEYNKISLYREKLNFENDKYTHSKLTKVFWDVQLNEIDGKTYQYFLFRPNFTAHFFIVFNDNKYPIFFPIKKRILDLKLYLIDALNIPSSYILLMDSDMEMDDNSFINSSYNKKILTINTDPSKEIKENKNWEMHYSLYLLGKEKLSPINQSIKLSDFENKPHSLAEALKIIMRFNRIDSNFNDEIYVLFNGIPQNQKEYAKNVMVNSFFCDEFFYRFVILYGSFASLSKYMRNTLPDINGYYENDDFKYCYFLSEIEDKDIHDNIPIPYNEIPKPVFIRSFNDKQKTHRLSLPSNSPPSFATFPFIQGTTIQLLDITYNNEDNIPDYILIQKFCDYFRKYYEENNLSSSPTPDPTSLIEITNEQDQPA